MAVLVGVIVLFDSLEIIRRSYSRDIPFGVVLEMVMMKLPSLIQKIIPFAILLGGILAFARLTRTSELVVTRAAGVSVWQFLAPAIIISILLGIFIMAVFNPLSAVMLSRYEQVEAKYFRGNSSMLSVSSTGLWLRQRSEENSTKTIIHALHVSHQDMKLYDVTFFLFKENDEFDLRLDAKSAELEDGYWYIKDGVMLEPGKIAGNVADYKLETNLSAYQIQESFSPPGTISFWELPGFIRTLKEAGFSALRHSLYWHSVLVTPFLLVAMVLFAAAFSLRSPRQGRTGAMMAGGILAGFIIYFISDLVSAIGLSGSIPVFMAAWVPVIISLLLGVSLMLHLEDG